MSDNLGDYLAKRSAAVAAEKAAISLVAKINEASQALGPSQNPKNHHPNWRNIRHPRLPEQDGRPAYAQALVEWPSFKDVLEQIGEYRQSLALATEAFQKLQPHQREGVLPPP